MTRILRNSGDAPGSHDVLVHVGVQRAASTYLQERVFRGHPGIRYLGRSKPRDPDWLIRWNYADPGRFAEVRDDIAARVREMLRADRLNVLSSENFCLYGGLAALQAERLGAILPEARIVLVLRDPIDRMLSFHRYAVRKGDLFEPFEASIDWMDPPFVFYKRKPIYLPDYRYDEHIAAYERVFGHERVCVLRYEELEARPERFWASLSAFAGVRLEPREGEDVSGDTALEEAINASPEPASVSSLRLANLRSAAGRAFPGARVTTGEGLPGEEPIPDELRDRLIAALAGRCGGYY